jgi:hypothetical protein
VRTLREKVGILATKGNPNAWMKELAKSWMEDDPDEAGYPYVDGDVRVYHSDKANLPRRFVSRERLCLRGTTDYWVNDAVVRPFFVVAARLAHARPVRNAQNPARPAKIRARNLALQHRRSDRRQKLAGIMQAIVERGVGQLRHASQMGPRRRIPQRQTARTARQRKPQQRLRAGNALPPQKRIRLGRERVEVDFANHPPHDRGPLFAQERCQFVHLPYESHHYSSSLEAYPSAYGDRRRG